MNDEQMQPRLEVWVREREIPRPKVQTGVAKVMADVSQTRQQGRWWPLPAFERPVPIPATDRRQPARGFTMFSAVKFVVAGVIVALFGGFLMMGVLTTPQDGEMAPAAVTESPTTEATTEPTEAPTTSVRSDILSGVTLTVEEVEPGVFRVVDDGVRDLGTLGRPSTRLLEEAVLVDHAGGVWRLTSTLGGPSSLYFRLGAEDESFIGPDDPDREWTGLAAFTFEFTPDGRLATDESEAARFFEREGSTTSEDLGLDGVHAVEWQEDGTIWLLDNENGLVRAWPDGGLAVLDWRYVYDGMVAPEGLVVTPDGEVWLMVRAEGVYEQYLDPTEAFLRLDGVDWETVGADFEVVTAPDGIASNGPGIAFDVGPDGTLWTAGDAQYPHQRLARYDDAGWTIFGEADGAGLWGGQRLFGDMPVDMVRVAPDGSAWVNAAGPERLCGGIARFDGTTWSSFLPGRCIGDYDFASDGAVWVVAQEQHDPDYPSDELDIQTYVITPEAVAAIEAEVTEPPSAEQPTVTEGATTTAEELPSGMVTEEVAPGVFRVVNDGARDLSFEGWSNSVVAGLDGSIWLWGPKDFVRLGSPAEESHTWPKGSGRAEGLMVARDGTVWMHDAPPSEGEQVARLRSNDGGSWTERLRAVALGALTIAPDGTVWAAYAGEDEEAGFIVARLGADGWEPLGGSIPAWVGDIFVTRSGEVWVAVVESPGNFGIWRYREDDGEWQQVAIDTVRLPHSPFGHGIEVGADGTVWFAGIEPLMAEGEPVMDAKGDITPGDSFLMRFDGSEWQRWGPADGVPSPPFAADIELEQAPDGGLWMTMARYPHAPLTEHEGIYRFDGSSWRRFLSGHRVIEWNAWDVAPDGSVWLLARRGGAESNTVDVYVITPEAVAASE